MALNGKTTDEKIWNFLKSAGMNDCGAAGMMGNLYAESGLKPQNLQNSYEKKLGFTDETYTAAVDSGKYANFAGDAAGYGLAQWTYKTRKAALLAYAKAAGKSVGDLETQLGFLLKELKENYKGIFAMLKTAASVAAASNEVLTKFERPADQSEAVKAKRAGYGQKYFDAYAGKTAAQNGGAKTMNVKEIRKNFVASAAGLLGAKEGSAQHRAIIDGYNAHKPLARNYKVKYTDAWCATFASYVAILAGYTDIIPTECGCEKQIALWQQKGRWVENDAYTPEAGDYIYYDWQDSGVGDCKGNADHVGIVEDVQGGTITVIEGNKNNSVERRKIAVNERYIRGYGVPEFEKKETAGAVTPQQTQEQMKPQPQQKQESKQPETVYTVQKGDTLSKIAAKYGTTYQKIASYNGIANPNKIFVGQKIRIPGSGSHTYTVKHGDSLWAIADKQLGDGSRYNEIKQLNGLTSNVIYSGQTLKLPEK